MKIITFCFLCLIVSCKEKFIREEQVLSYLRDVHETTISNQAVVVLLQSDFCGACAESNMRYLEQKLKSITMPIYIILASDSKGIKDRLCGDNIKYFSDQNFEYESYGLRLTYDAILFYSDYNLECWYKLSVDNHEKIAECIVLNRK